MTAAPTIAEIEATRRRIAPYVIETPTLPYYGREGPGRLGRGTEIWLKLELFQRTGSFKPRGALNVVLNLSDEERARGLTALSAGNHAIATAYAAKVLGVSAKVVMPRIANPYRVGLCRDFGAEIVFADSLQDLFRVTDRLVSENGRVQVHPFEGPRTFQGTATVGWEICRDAPDLDAVIVPIGGGGLIAGIASAIKQLRPACQVFGVEPAGARGMSLSLAAGEALPEVPVETIADSLGPPFHTPGAFALVQRYVEEVVTVEDRELIAAMALMFADLKLVVEPAGAAALAALLGPLAPKLRGKRVGLVVCGGNIDLVSYGRLLGLCPS